MTSSRVCAAILDREVFSGAQRNRVVLQLVLLASGCMHYASGLASEKAPPAALAPELEGELPRLEPDDVQLIEAEPKRLDLSVWNDAEAVRGAANRQLSGSLLEAAVKRLGNMGLFGALAFAAYLAWLGLLGWSQLGAVAGTALKVSAAGIVLSLLLLAVTKLPKVPAHHIADLGKV